MKISTERFEGIVSGLRGGREDFKLLTNEYPTKVFINDNTYTKIKKAIQDVGISPSNATLFHMSIKTVEDIEDDFVYFG